MKHFTKLLLVAIFVMSTPLAAQKPDLWAIRTRDSVGIQPTAPMTGRYPTPPVYSRWISELAQCEGFPTPSLAGFTFVEINASDFQVNADTVTTYFVVTLPAAQTMFISIGHALDEAMVKHELLHVLLFNAFPDLRYTHGPLTHPEQYYGTTDNPRCGVELGRFDK